MFQFAKVVRLVTYFLFLTILLLVYAYVPLTLDVQMDGIGRVGRSFFFYSALGVFLVLHFALYFLRVQIDRMGVGLWVRFAIHALPSVLFFSLTLLIGYVGILNNAQDIEPARYFYLNYLSAGLPLIWLAGFLFVVAKGR